jgi:hypothetical protein
MTLEANLAVLLKQVCDQTFPDFAPPGTKLPYITFQQIYGDVISYLGKEVSSKENAVMQINVWSATRKEAKAMILQIESLLTLAVSFQASPVAASVSDFEADLPAYCSRQDFSIWADRPK